MCFSFFLAFVQFFWCDMRAFSLCSFLVTPACPSYVVALATTFVLGEFSIYINIL